MSTVTLHGKPVRVDGKLPTVGSAAPERCTAVSELR